MCIHTFNRNEQWVYVPVPGRLTPLVPPGTQLRRSRGTSTDSRNTSTTIANSVRVLSVVLVLLVQVLHYDWQQHTEDVAGIKLNVYACGRWPENADWFYGFSSPPNFSSFVFAHGILFPILFKSHKMFENWDELLPPCTRDVPSNIVRIAYFLRNLLPCISIPG